MYDIASKKKSNLLNNINKYEVSLLMFYLKWKKSKNVYKFINENTKIKRILTKYETWWLLIQVSSGTCG